MRKSEIYICINWNFNLRNTLMNLTPIYIMRLDFMKRGLIIMKRLLTVLLTFLMLFNSTMSLRVVSAEDEDIMLDNESETTEIVSDEDDPSMSDEENQNVDVVLKDSSETEETDLSEEISEEASIETVSNDSTAEQTDEVVDESSNFRKKVKKRILLLYRIHHMKPNRQPFWKPVHVEIMQHILSMMIIQ